MNLRDYNISEPHPLNHANMEFGSIKVHSLLENYKSEIVSCLKTLVLEYKLKQ